MSAIQIKNVPPELHEQLRERARREGRNLGEYALSVLQRDLTIPTTRDWLDRLKEDSPVHDLSSEEIVELIHNGRAERDEQILRSLSARD
jgi:antitoxin FitA